MRNLPVIVFLLCICISCSKEPEIEEIESERCFIAHAPDTYDFPVKPGTPEWEELETSEEMDSVLQIPGDVLQNISTSGLIETAMNYPAFGDLYLLDDYQLAFDRLTEHFNGFRELLDRSNSGIELSNRYRLMHPGCKENNYSTVHSIGANVHFSFAFIEMIIAQYDVLNTLNSEQMKALLQETTIKYQQKNDYDHSIFSKKHTMLIAGRILYVNNYSPFIKEYNENTNVKEFIDRVALYGDFTTLDLVLSHSMDYLNKN